MVPKRSDHYFDLLKFPEEAKEDALKQTMVNQEHMFRNQVQELHRVYQMQMAMMKNSRSKEISETQYMNYSRDEYRRKWSQRLSTGEFPAGYYGNHRNERFIHKGNGLGTQDKPIDVECYFNGETKSRTTKGGLSLSLNIGGKQKSWEEKATPASSPHVINLEEPSGSFLKRENEHVSGLVGADHSGDHSWSHFINKGVSVGTKRSLSFLDKITDFRGKSSLNQDFEEKRYEDPPSMKVSVVGEISSTCKSSTLWDLNEPPCDASPFDLNDDHTGVHSPVAAGSQESMLLDLNRCIKPNDDGQVLTVLEQHTPSSVLMMPPSSNDNSTNGGSIDLESCAKVSSENSEDQECLTSNSQHKDEFGLKSGFINSNAEEDSVEKAEIDMSPISAIPSNTLKTMQSTSNLQQRDEFGLKSGRINSNAEEDSVEKADIDMNPISSIPSNTLKTMQSLAHSEGSTPGVNSIQCSESSQIDSLGNENERSSLDNDLIRRGAVSLLFFMSENSATGQNHPIHESQPQPSLDSFESAVLKLQESKSDDFNDVSSDHFEVKDVDEKDSPIKLRRGRRMKDFQKDILPSMSSLSRHEICEDVRLMEGVIRSREYKRLRSKDSGDQTWFTPVKSRRSRLNNVGRRSYN